MISRRMSEKADGQVSSLFHSWLPAWIKPTHDPRGVQMPQAHCLIHTSALFRTDPAVTERYVSRGEHDG